MLVSLYLVGRAERTSRHVVTLLQWMRLRSRYLYSRLLHDSQAPMTSTTASKRSSYESNPNRLTRHIRLPDSLFNLLEMRDP